MAKRFIDTNFFKNPFVRSLKGSQKVLYLFVICDCDNSGIWTKDLQVAEIFTGHDIKEKDFTDAFIATNKFIDLKNGKYFVPDFIEHQYPNGLTHKNPAHNNVIKELLKISMIDSDLNYLWCTSKGTMVMEKDKVEGKVKESTPKKDIIIPTEIEFLDYCKTIKGINYSGLEFSIKAKYQSWVANNWKDGNDNEIKNWKTKIMNTIPFLKQIGVQSSNQAQPTSEKASVPKSYPLQ